MIDKIDFLLDRITMYRLVFYVLLLLIATSSLFGFLGLLPFSGFSLIFTFCFITILCWATNTLFAGVFGAPTNVESVYITAFIITLIITPIQTLSDVFPVGWIAVISMASKYILALKRKHLFNPAVVAVVLSSIGYGLSASWWVGTAKLFPFVLTGGLLIVRKLRFERLFLVYFVTNVFITFVLASLRGSNYYILLNQVILNSPLIFFATIMLTEPSTLPPTKYLRSWYGVIVAILTIPQLNVFGFFLTPEMALVLGNVYSYVVSSKQKLFLTLENKLQIAPDIFDFIFIPKIKFAYEPGQYMEWTLDHDEPDSRGDRRYLTIASSPTESNLRLGVKFYPKGSSFKKTLMGIDSNKQIVGSQLAGDFTLPENPNQKLVFMAGGIGITPFRSIIKYLTDKNETRDIVLFYSNKLKEEIVYKDVFDEASNVIGLKTLYVLSDLDAVPAFWDGETGRVNAQMIINKVPDYKERIFYLSGPQPMVLAYEKVLREMGLIKKQIKKDYFPGYA